MFNHVTALDVARNNQRVIIKCTSIAYRGCTCFREFFLGVERVVALNVERKYARDDDGRRKFIK